MARHADLYRRLVRLYPRAFRNDFDGDLVQNFNWHAGKLMVFDAVFFVTASGAIVCLVIGVRTPRSPLERAVSAR